MLQATSRNGVPRKIVVVTDGNSNIPAQTEVSVNTAKLSGVEMFALGVGPGAFREELDIIASTLNNVELAVDFTSVYDSLSRYSDRLCGVANRPTTLAPTNCIPAEIILVVDGSTSVGEANFQTLKSELITFVQQLPASPNGAHVGVILFSGIVNSQIALSGDIPSLTSQINNLVYPSSGTLTNLGIDAALNMLQATSRNGVPRKIVVVTDGNSNIPALTEVSVNTAKLSGVEMFALGVGPGAFREELDTIASTLNNVEMAVDFTSVYDSLSRYSDRLCGVANQPTTLAPTNCAADVVFIIDSSSLTSFGNVYSEFITSVQGFVNQQAISDSAIRVGVVFTNDGATTQIPLNGDRTNLLTQINNPINLTPMGGQLELVNGINGAINVFNTDMLQRNVPRVAIVLAAQGSANGPTTTFEANSLQFLTGGSSMAVYTMGISTLFGELYNPAELVTIASNANNVYSAVDLQSLESLFNSIVAGKCAVLVSTVSLPPSVTTIAPIPTNCRADVVFIIDSSGLTSVDNLFTGFITSVQNFLNQQTISDSAVRVGVVFTNDLATTQIPLSGDKTNLLTQINNNLPVLSGQVELVNGINGAIDVFNNDALIGHAPRVAIVITPGSSANGPTTTLEANNLQFLNGGSVSTYAMGVSTLFGDLYNPTELSTIASDFNNVYVSLATPTLPSIFNSIVANECEVLVPTEPPPPPVTTMAPIPTNCRADVVFIIDSSGLTSVGNLFTGFITSVQNFLNQQTISDSAVRVGVVFTNDGTTSQIPLSGDKTNLLTQINNNLPVLNGQVELVNGINEAIDVFKNDALIGNAPRVAIVLTPGSSANGPTTTLEANNLQFLNGGSVSTYAMGVSTLFGELYNPTELSTIASNSNNVYVSLATPTLPSIFNSIVANECQVLVFTEPPPPPTLPPTTAPDCGADIVFVFDTSDLTKGDNLYSDFIQSAIDFVNTHLISNSAFRVGFAFTNDVQTIEVPLSSNRNELLLGLNSINQPIGGLDLGDGLNGAINIFNTDSSDRTAPQVTVLVTAGRSKGGVIPNIEATNLKLISAGGPMSVYSVGVQYNNEVFYNPTELTTIATDPINNVYQLPDTNSLLHTFNSIAAEECDTIQTPVYCNPTDIVLVVDGSQSIGDIPFSFLLANLVNFVQELPVSPNGLNVGVVVFSTGVQPTGIIPLTGDEGALTTAIYSLPYPEGQTNTDAGIDEASAMLNLRGRPGVNKVMVVITDGISDNTDLTQQAAIKARTTSIDMYALGVGNGVLEQELFGIASAPANVQRVADFGLIIPTFLQLSRALCFTPPPPTTLPPTTPAPPSCSADIVFVVDASDITKGGNVYTEILDSLRTFVGQEDISNVAKRVGIVFTNDQTTVQIPLSGDPSFLLNEINNNQAELGGGLVLGTGLAGAIDVFNNDPMSRNVPRVTVLLTVGRSRGGAFPVFQANALKALNGGEPMSVHSVGITSSNQDLYNPFELNYIASDPLQVHTNTDTGEVLQIISNIAAKECEIVPDLQSCNPRDIVLVIDGSQSVGPKSFKDLKTELVNFVLSLPNEVNIGVVVYSTDVKPTGIIPITSDRASLITAITNLPYPENGTMTNLGIEAGYSLLQTTGRPGVDQVMVVVTDGYSDDPFATKNSAKFVNDAGVNVYSIGVGTGVFYGELLDIASSQDNVQTATNFDAITFPFIQLSRTLCEPTCPVDVVFVVDASDVTNGGAVYDNFLASIRTFINQQSVGNTGTRVGIVFTNDVTAVEVPLSGDRNFLLNEINNNLNGLGGGLFLANGLNGAINIFNSDVNTRNAYRVTFVLTAGRSQGGVVPIGTISNLKNLPGTQVSVHSFGVPSPSGILYNINELQTIASDPFNDVHQVGDVTTMPLTFDQIIDTTCASGPPNIIATPAPPTPIPVCNPRDIVIVMDGSMSIGINNYNLLKTNVVDFTKQLQITPNDVNVGLVVFSDGVSSVIPLTGNAPYLETAIASQVYPEGGTRTDLGIAAGLNVLQSGRPGEDKIMIVITDGYSDLSQQTIDAAKAAKTAGVTVYAVGVGGISDVELNNIATGPAYVETAPNFNSVLQTLSLFARTLCDPVPTTPLPLINCPNPVDIVVVVDGSGSVGAGNFTTLKESVAKLIGDVNVSPTDVRLGVVLFSDIVYDELIITGDGPTLRNDILNMNFPNSITRTDIAIEAGLSMLTNYGRPFVPNTMIVITDGISKYPQVTAASAAAARAAGVNMYALGIGQGAVQSELLDIASSPGQAKTAADFDIDLIKIFEQLIRDACGA